MTMVVSPICVNKAGEKYAFVTFTQGKYNAEGKIPDCKIIKNYGFNDEEIAGLELYMKMNIVELKKIASKNNVFGAIMK